MFNLHVLHETSTTSSMIRQLLVGKLSSYVAYEIVSTILKKKVLLLVMGCESCLQERHYESNKHH